MLVAGAQPIDLRFTGQIRYGWNAFPLHEFGTPSIFATTRKFVASNRPLVMDVNTGIRGDDAYVQDAAGHRGAAATISQY